MTNQLYEEESFFETLAAAMLAKNLKLLCMNLIIITVVIRTRNWLIT